MSGRGALVSYLTQPGFWRKGGAGYSLIQVNILALLCQCVQLGAMPALIALRLDGSGYSVAVLGAVAAAPWVAVLLFGRYVPRLLLRHGYFDINASALLLSAASVLVMLLTHSAILAIAANLCLGVGLILRWIACDSWVISLAPEEIQGRSIGIYETLMGCGIAAGPVIIGTFGSRGPVPLLACLSLILLAGFALLCIERPRPMTDTNHVPAPTPLRGLQLMMLAAFIAGFTETASVSLLPVLSQHSHWPIASTLALGVFALGGVLLQIPIGYLADRLGFRAAQTLTAAAIISTSAALILFGHSPIALVLGLFFLGGAAGGMNTLAVIEAGATVVPESIAAATVRIALAYTIGSIVGPSSLGALAAFFGAASFPFAFTAVGMIFCIAQSTGASRSHKNAVLAS